MDIIRLSIPDQVSLRYARSRAVVYGVAAFCFLFFALLIFSLKPSFPLLAAATFFFALGATVCILRNPLGILTLRVQKRLFAREFVLDPHGLTIIMLDGDTQRFDSPEAEIFYMPGPGGQDYYLQIKARSGKTGSFYLGCDPDLLKPLAELLENGGSLKRFDRPAPPDLASIKTHFDQYFN